MGFLDSLKKLFSKGEAEQTPQDQSAPEAEQSHEPEQTSAEPEQSSEDEPK